MNNSSNILIPSSFQYDTPLPQSWGDCVRTQAHDWLRWEGSKPVLGGRETGGVYCFCWQGSPFCHSACANIGNHFADKVGANVDVNIN